MLSTTFFTLAATVAHAFSALVTNATFESVFVKQNVNWTEHQFQAPGPGLTTSGSYGVMSFEGLRL